MGSDRLAFLTQMVELVTSTVSFEERLGHLVRLLGRHLKVDLALYFGLDKAKEVLFLNISSQGPVPPQMRVEFPLGKGVVGETALFRKFMVLHRPPTGVGEANLALEKLHPAFETLLSCPVADDNFLYGVLVLMDKASRPFTPAERQSTHLAALLLAGTLRQALIQEDSKKRIAELSVLFEVGKALSSTIELDELLERIVTTTAKVIHARGAALKIVDQATGETQVSAQYGKVPIACPSLPQVGTPTALPGELPYLQGQEADAGGQLHYFLAVPLTLKGQLAGSLCVLDRFSPDGGYLPFDPETRPLLYTMAGLITSAIENALGHQQVEALAEINERMVKNLTALQEIARALLTTVQVERLEEIILKGLTLEQGLGFDRAALLLVDEAHQELRGVRGACRTGEPAPGPLPEALLLPLAGEFPLDDWQIPLRPDQGALARAVSQMRSFHLLRPDQEPGLPPEVRKKYDAQECFIVPLVVKDRATGVMMVDNQASRRPLEQEPLHALQMLATQVALVLENARLYATIEANNRELLLIRERMLESDRLAALSSLAAGMAHEIRNPLVAIGGFARRIFKQVKKDLPIKGYAEVILEEVSRLEKVLREILDFAGENLSYYGDHDLNQLIEEALALVGRDLDASRIQLEKDFALLPSLHCDDRQIKQVFYNLFHNARQVMLQGGILSIRTYPVEKEDGLYAAAAVTDTGGGIPLEVLHNIFNPFFSTKDYGTGLGLSIAQRIVTRHYGQIEIINELGKGVTFIVTLPVAKYCLIRPAGASQAPGLVQ